VASNFEILVGLHIKYINVVDQLARGRKETAINASKIFRHVMTTLKTDRSINEGLGRYRSNEALVSR
jgi:hypothetical protein